MTYDNKHWRLNKDLKFDKKSNWNAEYIPNFRIVRLIGTKQEGDSGLWPNRQTEKGKHLWCA